MTNVRCVDEAVLAGLTRVGGVSAVHIVEDEPGYTASVVLRSTREMVHLATTRNMRAPRRFKSVDVAVNKLSKLIGATEFVVTLAGAKQR